jgi:cyclopropane fatty-acyl-phospholipid synthase-like methyltransferase
MTLDGRSTRDVERASAHYDRVAEAWRLVMGEDLHYGCFGSGVHTLEQATARLTQVLASLAEIDAAHVILDVGCGVGGPALDLARNYGCRVVGISTSAVGVAAARERASRAGINERVSFDVRNALANGYEDASFDRVWLLECAHLIEPKPTLFAECARVLRPGGRLVLCDIIRFAVPDLPTLYQQAASFNLLDAVFGRARVETLDRYRELAREAGLAVERVQDVSAEVEPTFAHGRERLHAHRDAIAALIGDEDRMRFVEACGVLQKLWREQTLGYGSLAAVKTA